MLLRYHNLLYKFWAVGSFSRTFSITIFAIKCPTESFLFLLSVLLLAYDLDVGQYHMCALINCILLCIWGRPTLFIEIIQRVGCMLKDDEGKAFQKGGCGGFGKGNFSELFKSIEEYEKTLEEKCVAEPATA